MSNPEMAPQKAAEARRRRDDVRRHHRAWCENHTARLAELPEDLAKGIRSFALQQVWDWVQAGAGEKFSISPEAWALFRKQWISQTRRLRYGPVHVLSEAEWRSQMDSIEQQYWPMKLAA
jgi:hypothetical protein